MTAAEGLLSRATASQCGSIPSESTTSDLGKSRARTLPARRRSQARKGAPKELSLYRKHFLLTIAFAMLAVVELAMAQSPVDRFRIVAQDWHPMDWHRGLAVAAITFENANDFSIYEPTIACEFVRPNGELIGTRATHVHRAFRPGKMQIDGIEFSIRERDAVPGSCRVVSVLTSPAPD